MDFDNYTETVYFNGTVMDNTTAPHTDLVELEATTAYFMGVVYEPIYDEKQLKVLAWASLVPATLSLIGSSMIVYAILFAKEKRNIVYNRIMLGLSCYDILVSCGQIFFGSWTIPIEAAKMTVGARGNWATCTVSGFLLTLFSGSIVYTACLSFYFVLKVVRECKDPWIARYVEPIFHILAIAMTLFTATITAVNGEINPSDTLAGYCGIVPYPPTCEQHEDMECLRGGKLNRVFVAFLSAGVVMISLLVILISMALLVCKVRSTERKMHQYANGNSNSATQMKLTRKTGRMALSYIGCFLLTFVWYLAFSIADYPRNPEYRSQNFILAFTIKFFTPMQGFFNALIFLNSQYGTNIKQTVIRVTSKLVPPGISSMMSEGASQFRSRLSTRISVKRSKLLQSSQSRSTATNQSTAGVVDFSNNNEQQHVLDFSNNNEQDYNQQEKLPHLAVTLSTSNEEKFVDDECPSNVSSELHILESNTMALI